MSKEKQCESKRPGGIGTTGPKMNKPHPTSATIPGGHKGVPNSHKRGPQG